MANQTRLSMSKRARFKPKSVGNNTSQSRHKNKILTWLATNKPDMAIKGADLPLALKRKLKDGGISPKLYTNIIYNQALITLDELYELAAILEVDAKELV